MGEVVELRPDIEFIAICPECECECWDIVFDEPDPKKISYFRCANEECGYWVSFEKILEIGGKENVAAEED